MEFDDEYFYGEGLKKNIRPGLNDKLNEIRFDDIYLRTKIIHLTEDETESITISSKVSKIQYMMNL